VKSGEKVVKVYELNQIETALQQVDTVSIIEQGFVAYSNGEVVVPPVGEMIFSDPPGDVHIKYGYIKNDEYYVIKIASGFYKNQYFGIPSSDGLMLIFNQKTGELLCLLNDRGYLTNVRTAAAGAVAARHLAKDSIRRIGIIGAGLQARMQLSFLAKIVACKDVMVWGVSNEELARYKSDMEKQGFSITTCLDANEVANCSDLIVTTTPSTTPLILADAIQKGTHITAIGSDTPVKQELDSQVLAKADIVVADSISQCERRGEIFKALEAGVIGKDKICELGNVIQGKAKKRSSDEQITVADLTGVAVQDIQIAKAVYAALNSNC